MTAELRAGAAGSMVGQPSGEQKHTLMRRADAHTCLITLIELEAANPGGSFLLELFPASTALMLHDQCGRSGENGLKSVWDQLAAAVGYQLCRFSSPVQSHAGAGGGARRALPEAIETPQR